MLHKQNFDPLLLNDTNQRDYRDNEFNSAYKGPNCNYHFVDTLVTNYDVPESRLTVLSFNIRCVPQHFSDFNYQCLNEIGIKCNIIGLCETRLTDNICNLNDVKGSGLFFNSQSIDCALWQYSHQNHFCILEQNF